jgi:hypothetical protein
LQFFTQVPCGCKVPSTPDTPSPVAPDTPSRGVSNPPELVGEWVGDGKISGCDTGVCVIVVLGEAGSYMVKVNAGGFCSEVDVDQVPHKLFDDIEITSEGTVTGWECMDCSDTEVFGVRDGSGYAKRYDEYEEMNSSCGKFYVELAEGGSLCVLFKTSLLKETTERRNNLRRLEGDSEENHIVVNTLTVGPIENGDPSCPADIIFDKNQLLHVAATQSLQVVAQEPGDLLDPSNWSCYSAE